MLSLREAVDRLASPYALEELSCLAGRPLLAVDLDGDTGRVAPERLARARSALGQLACASAAVAADPGAPGARALAEGFDLVVADRRALVPIARTAERCPLATLGLVQLLRLGARRPGVHAGLLAESAVYGVLQSGPEFSAWLASRGPGRPVVDEPGPPVRVERVAGRLTLVLNRPLRRNAFSTAMRDALAEALHVAACDSTVSEIALRAEGPCFCSGGDLDEFGSHPDPATAHAVRSTRNVARLLASCASRVAVRVHGACVGAGVELPAFAARVVAREDARFQLPELGMGLVPGSGGTVSIPRRIGRQRTAWLALTGERVDAETALEWGLVDAVEP